MAMRPVNLVEESTGVKVHDPTVVRAMEAWERLDDIERANVYRSTIQHMVAYRRTGDVAHLDRLTRMHEANLRIDRIPGLREKIRAQRDAPTPVPASDADIEALIAKLRGKDAT